MPEYDNTNRGVLFKNNKQRAGKKDAEYQGNLNVDGVDYWISAWVKDGSKGKFFSLSVKLKKDVASPPSKSNVSDDEVPF